MDRREQLSNLQNYTQELDKDITMILQNLQWDRNLLQKGRKLSTCEYSEEHKMPSFKLNEHKEICFLKCNGYSVEDTLLPELLDKNSPTVVTFNSATIKRILDNAAKTDPLFKRGHKTVTVEPLPVERLAETYTADERRAIHDAVVGSVQSYRDSEDFVVPSGSAGGRVDEGAGKSRLERLAELRDRRRRRAKYRAPPKTRNYSVVLRDVISAQMELLNEVRENSETNEKYSNPENNDNENVDYMKKGTNHYCNRYENVDSPINVKNDKYNTHRSRPTEDHQDNEYKNTRRYDRSRFDNARSREKDDRERSTSRDPNKYREYRSERSSHRNRDRHTGGSNDRKTRHHGDEFEDARHRHVRVAAEGGHGKKDRVHERRRDYKY